jgi:hypothetical protein
LPVLFTGEGQPIEPLLRYQVARRRRSLSWHRRVVRAVRLLLEYAAVNPALCSKPQVLFEHFVSRLDSGTIDESGLDSSGIYWFRRKPSYVKALCGDLTAFSAHMSKYYDSPQLNPLREANLHERICKYAGKCYRHDKDFLSHLQSRSDLYAKSAHVENSFGRQSREPRVDGETRTSFPQERFGDLIFRGFAVRPKVLDPVLRLNIRDVLITLLLHGGGLRCSEAFHMFINDVIPNPLDETSALIRIGHPSWGEIKWRDASGQVVTTTRSVYLRRHGLPQREDVAGPMHAGWKNPVLDGKYFLQVRWAEPQYGQLFLTLWRHYLLQYTLLPVRPAHPWAWVSFDKGHAGEPLKMGRYIAAHARAIHRIGLEPDFELGTMVHNHRHAYAKWLESLKLKSELIRRFLHHASLQSQQRYLQMGEGEMHAELQRGLSHLNSHIRPSVFSEPEQREAIDAHTAALLGRVTSIAQPLIAKWTDLTVK